jgi:phage tail sheath protein FI
MLNVPQVSQSASAAVLWRKNTQNISSSYSSLWTPDVLDTDTYSGKTLYIPPAAYATAQFARAINNGTAGTVGAGTDAVLDISGLYTTYTQGQQGILYQNGINYFRNKPGTGYLVWGNLTQDPVYSPTNQLSIRLLLITVESGLKSALDSTVFKLNNSFTRLGVVQRCSGFLQQFSDNGDFDTSIDAGFMVKCDEENNPAPIRQANRLVVDVYVKPTSPAIFITINLLITDQGVSFKSLISSRPGV